MNIIIANSVGIDNNNNYIIHSPSRWSEGVKTKENWFTYYPWELAYTSSLLKQKTNHNISFIDGCLEKLNTNSYLKKIITYKPDYLIIESATRTITENLNLALKIKEKLGTKIIFCGQHASAYPEPLLNAGVDFICIGEYEYTVLDIINKKEPSHIKGLYPNQRRELLNINTLPFPEDSDVSRLAYATPGEPSSEYLEIQMYASRGCLMSCNYCVARNIYYNKPNFRPRQISNIIAELNYLKTKYPRLEGIFFDEEEHNGQKDFILQLTKGIIDSNLNGLHYEAMGSFYKLDEELMLSMKKAGYYKIRGGIETGSDSLAKNINRHFNSKLLLENLELAKKIGLKMYGTFMLGIPPGDITEEKKTLNLIKQLIKNKLLTNVQISIATPQPGTPLFVLAKEKNFLTEAPFSQFDGGHDCILTYPTLSNAEIKDLYQNSIAMRNHLFLLNNLKHNFFSWIKNNLQKKGILLSFKKIIRRLFQEIIYLIKY